MIEAIIDWLRIDFYIEFVSRAFIPIYIPSVSIWPWQQSLLFIISAGCEFGGMLTLYPVFFSLTVPNIKCVNISEISILSKISTHSVIFSWSVKLLFYATSTPSVTIWPADIKLYFLTIDHEFGNCSVKIWLLNLDLGSTWYKLEGWCFTESVWQNESGVIAENGTVMFALLFKIILSLNGQTHFAPLYSPFLVWE